MDNDENTSENNYLITMSIGVANRFSQYDGEMSDETDGLTINESQVLEEAAAV